MHPVDVGGPVVDLGGGHQLAALGDAGDQRRGQVGAGGVDGRRVAGRPGTQDQHAGMKDEVRSSVNSKVRVRGGPAARPCSVAKDPRRSAIAGVGSGFNPANGHNSRILADPARPGTTDPHGSGGAEAIVSRGQ
jgi:hypothetical protein